MPRAKKVTPENPAEVPTRTPMATASFPEPNKKLIALLDETMPADNGMTNNQVRASIRETRAKVNEIINLLNIR